MKLIYTRPSGKQFEILEVLVKGQTTSIVKYKEGKYIKEQQVFNKQLSEVTS